LRLHFPPHYDKWSVRSRRRGHRPTLSSRRPPGAPPEIRGAGAPPPARCSQPSAIGGGALALRPARGADQSLRRRQLARIFCASPVRFPRKVTFIVTANYFGFRMPFVSQQTHSYPYLSCFSPRPKFTLYAPFVIHVTPTVSPTPPARWAVPPFRGQRHNG